MLKSGFSNWVLVNHWGDESVCVLFSKLSSFF